ncbi:MAG: DUF2946 family protein [Paraburkholderia tropica]|uniref:DUF2946 family protein n=1 Tax=Paraburkholderia tropica TaxID=92647 RepID=A0ABX5MH20_9BURK|nr:DUF2946 family protein [Paraburkholderia tropica]MDE1143390.1 DUF2946 family protein [Paraburkholderia tropica]PXX10602.1 hypothetical protein C7400_12179 [Paraburkholderia tropica]PZW75358.1 hypothetical protein C7399_12179 [Paraburkholderia tropica]
MDDIVKQALARWPNVPSCTGWLRLDARGHWRLRDEADQAAGAPGTSIRHEALIAFINRNYERDDQGQWFFQNGPQCVYVELEYAPWVVRLASVPDSAVPDANGTLALTDHTGHAFTPVAAFIDENGSVLFADAADANLHGGVARVALLHDHDLGLFAEHATLADDGQSGTFHWRADAALPLQAIARVDVPSRFAFVPSPEHAEQAARAAQ